MNRNEFDYLVTKKNASKVCRKCLKDMILEDLDFNFKGCYDAYFLCKHCNATCVEYVRFGMPYKEVWGINEDNLI